MSLKKTYIDVMVDQLVVKCWCEENICKAGCPVWYTTGATLDEAVDKFKLELRQKLLAMSLPEVDEYLNELQRNMN